MGAPICKLLCQGVIKAQSWFLSLNHSDGLEGV